jgi:diguanylate cyclase (GGDEF)-like protein
VTRLYRPGGTVVRKQPLGPGANERLQHERGLLGRLAGVPGIVQVASARDDGPGGSRARGSIVLEDAGDTSLAERTTPLTADEVRVVSLALARAVAAMHRHGVVHRDISPANIVLRDGQVTLIDFALATTSAEIRPEFTHPSEIVGTLPYLAPEQTGRSGRPADQRADLYAIGATLYELATGEPPFGVGDPVRLIHDQMARVAAPPRRRNPSMPPALSDIIMHLLEKEPDNRYQTADGLVHDLEQLAHDRAGVRVGEHDFPIGLMPPSRLAGRDSEKATLAAAFERAMSGWCRGVLVSGAAGVGKTSLIDELRPLATTNNGYFVAGKFDQYRRDQEYDAVRQAMRSLGRLLLAEPDDELTGVRRRLLQALGPNAGLATAALPEFSTLLGVPADPGDPLTAQVRARHTAMEILRAVASRGRPVVFVVEDLQWAARTPLGVVDAVFSGEESLDGVLLVAAYREAEVDATQPLAAMLARWHRQQVAPDFVRLGNLPVSTLAEMLADMLRLAPADAATLAEAIAPYTKGNPYDTIELLNALRRDGVLRPGEDGWQWDASALRRLGRADIGDLLHARVMAMPGPTRELLESMACLGGVVEVGLLRAATGLAASAVDVRLAPAQEDGLVVAESGPRESIRFRHDRVREVVLGRMSQQRRDGLRLRLARRLAVRPELFAVAAQQYLPVIDAVREPQERRAAIDLFRRGAEQAKILSNYPVVERYFASAVALADADDTSTLIELQTGRHEALYSLARLDEADEVYRAIERLSPHNPARHLEATLVQVNSLTNRNRPQEALNLGIELLRELGCSVPTHERLDRETDHRIEALYRWVEHTSEADDLCRPEVDEPRLLAIGALMTRLMAPAYFCDPGVLAWLTLEAAGMWAEHGPCHTLIAPVSHLAFVTIALRQDYRTAHLAMRRILAVGRARGYEPDTSESRFLYAVSTGHWFEPLEENVALAQQARDGLLQGGDLQKTSHTYFVTLPQLFDSAASLDDFVAELDAGLAFARRTGNDEAAIAFRAYQRLVAALRGDVLTPSTVLNPGTEELDREELASNTNTAGHVYAARAVAAALLYDRTELDRRSADLMTLLPAIPALYLTATAHVVRALALADGVNGATPAERTAAIAELDSVIDWLARRAADAPGNFLHLLRLAEAERAGAAGDFRTAAVTFDAARRQAAALQRPWHRALINQRAARFYLAHGLQCAGAELLGAARRDYLDWGATAKVSQLDWAYPTLEASRGAEPAGQPSTELAGRRSSIMIGAIDLLAILAASKALSSETSVDGLRARVVDVLSTMTGATEVHLLLRNDDHGWLLSGPEPDGGTIPLAEAGRRRLVPLSVVRYAERTGEPLVVNDGTSDDRFARDPYFRRLESCSLLVVPIFYRGSLRALLVLENRLIRGAFAAERLEGVMLIAGQLAVSLDNALVYASLEQKVAARTEELALANERLEQLSITDSLTGMANRRRFDMVLDAEWLRAQRLGEPIGLAMVDIDRFKLYNDHNGHAAGDKCLHRVAIELASNIRAKDLAARYGGEEFAIVMPGTDMRAGVAAAERLRRAVIALAEPHEQVAEGIVTVSIGVAAMVPSSTDAAASVVEMADAELYRAKRAGRNRVSPAGPHMSAG